MVRVLGIVVFGGKGGGVFGFLLVGNGPSSVGSSVLSGVILGNFGGGSL